MGPFLHSLKKPSQRETAGEGHASAQSRRRRRRALAVLLAVVVVVVVVLATPAGRRQLRESFTQLPSTYTELYFTSTPVPTQTRVIVPVAVVRHGGGRETYRLRVWLQSSAGRTTASTTTSLAERPNGHTSTTVQLPLRRGSQFVYVALLGHPQTLHFRLGSQTSDHVQGPS